MPCPELKRPGFFMVTLAEVASDCHPMAVSTRNSLARATREFLERHSRDPTNPAIGYYAPDIPPSRTGT